MILDFSENSGVKYTLTCLNLSGNSCYFYLYQRLPAQPVNGIYSLIWMASPYKLGTQSFMTFKWTVDISFSWLNTGKIQVGGIPGSGGSIPADLSTTTFNLEQGTPQFSTPVQGVSQEEFSIKQGSNIPNGVFSTGIGMSGFPIFTKQSYANEEPQVFGTNMVWYVAATTQPVNAMQIINQDGIDRSIELKFPLNTYNLSATLKEDNTWAVAIN